MVEGVASNARRAKVPFEWNATQVPREIGYPQTVTWSTSGPDERFVETAVRALSASLQKEDIESVERLGGRGAVQQLMAAPEAWGCSYLPTWWETLLIDGDAAGFVMPVTYDSTKGSLGTIFHNGIVPEFRGHGYGRFLLRRTVEVLVDYGVHRIFCDTNVENLPMIRNFESEGWRRLPLREVPISANYDPGDGFDRLA